MTVMTEGRALRRAQDERVSGVQAERVRWPGTNGGRSFDGLRTNGFRVRGSFDGLPPRRTFSRTNGLGGFARNDSIDRGEGAAGFR